MPVVDCNDQGFARKPLRRLTGGCCQEVGQRDNIVSFSQGSKMNIGAYRVGRVINDNRYFIALPYLAN
jgi:hypothetical protein